jgi:F-type H+-transporting ATPase subunit delta
MATLIASRTIATRYARALFSLAGQAGSEAISAELEALVSLLDTSPEFRRLCTSPVINREAKLRGVVLVAKQAGASDVMTRFLQTLAQNERLDLLPLVRDALLEQAEKAKGEVRADIITARPLPAKARNALTAALSQAIGTSVKPVMQVDEAVIGGIKIRIGSKELDATVQGKLARAASRLYEGIQRA